MIRTLRERYYDLRALIRHLSATTADVTSINAGVYIDAVEAAEREAALVADLERMFRLPSRAREDS